MRDHHLRRTYVERINQILEVEFKWSKHLSLQSDEYNLPSLAKRLEYHLYMESKTLEEYDDRYVDSSFGVAALKCCDLKCVLAETAGSIHQAAPREATMMFFPSVLSPKLDAYIVCGVVA